MSVLHRIGVGLIGAALVIAVAACRPAPLDGAPPSSAGQALSTVSKGPSLRQAGDVVWGRVPYCNCFAGSATASVASALQDANLAASVKELSPRDGWLYFAVTFDPQSVASDQVGAAMTAGGAEVVAGPP